ncbi:glycosyltransferase family 2 protein [Pantoea deleyi]|uniref:glycosyltransferase family 2 protein n=3 Tax=Pantoea deleyi TaxID=470932 RepID=UPI001B8077FC|nr:glycosyltransferase family 2 protein [Pantoea deleyi]
MSNNGKVSILMGTYNGERYLTEQLQSIASQTYTNWNLIISDDGSTDRTCEIIEEFSLKYPDKVVIQKGPGKGFAANFLCMLQRKDIDSEFYAFCDQDDIWLEDKLEVAVFKLNSISQSEYRLYGSRTQLIDSNGEFIGHSPCFTKAFNFNNALLQSYAGGNTMVFSRGLKELFEKLPADLKIVSHDWILYVICSAMNGNVIYDREPKILYRQHEKNLVGSNTGLLSKFTRFNRLFSGEFKAWSEMNCEAIDSIKDKMPYDNQITYQRFCSLRDGLSKRTISFLKGKFYRQSFVETCAFFVMNVFKKLI